MIIALLRYTFLVEGGRGAKPEELVFADRPLQVLGVIWAVPVRARGVRQLARQAQRLVDVPGELRDRGPRFRRSGSGNATPDRGVHGRDRATLSGPSRTSAPASGQ